MLLAIVLHVGLNTWSHVCLIDHAPPLVACHSASLGKYGVPFVLVMPVIVTQLTAALSTQLSAVNVCVCELADIQHAITTEPDPLSTD